MSQLRCPILLLLWLNLSCCVEWSSQQLDWRIQMCTNRLALIIRPVLRVWRLQRETSQKLLIVPVGLCSREIHRASAWETSPQFRSDPGFRTSSLCFRSTMSLWLHHTVGPFYCKPAVEDVQLHYQKYRTNTDAFTGPTLLLQNLH